MPADHGTDDGIIDGGENLKRVDVGDDYGILCRIVTEFDNTEELIVTEWPLVQHNLLCRSLRLSQELSIHRQCLSYGGVQIRRGASGYDLHLLPLPAGLLLDDNVVGCRTELQNQGNAQR